MKDFTEEEAKIIEGDAGKELKKISSESIQTCITSPPYWGLRDYGIEGQIGAEEKVNDYINKLANIFDEVKRVLKDNGTLWLNIGDSYTSGGRSWRAPDDKHSAREMSYRPDTPDGLKPKDLVGVPWRVALELQRRGWYLRSDIIWHKPNSMPESVKDRPTQAHEYLFLLSKSEQYYYDYESVKVRGKNGSMRNRRTVWSINTEGYSGAHFATFPQKLVKPCIKAGSKKGERVLDPFFGSGTVGLVCERLNRSYIGIELNPEYIELAKERISKCEEELI